MRPRFSSGVVSHRVCVPHTIGNDCTATGLGFLALSVSVVHAMGLGFLALSVVSVAPQLSTGLIELDCICNGQQT